MIDEIKIMQLADGTLPMNERAEVEKAIKSDPKLKNYLKIIKNLRIYYLSLGQR